MADIDHSKVEYFVEIRGVYDGWSFAVMKDGHCVNRWPVEDPRHAATEELMREHAEWRRSKGYKCEIAAAPKLAGEVSGE